MAPPTSIPILGRECVFVGRSFISSFLPSDLPTVTKASKMVIISDSIVFPLHGQTLVDAIVGAGLPTPIVKVVPAGEHSKCREVKAHIEEFMLSHGCNRDTLVFSLGGGVMGDLAGYVAATYMRGVPFIQVPTSLLAMVDASIGGKTGIDVPTFGKNLVGAFHAPRRVYIDTAFLDTLPTRHIANGLAECLKVFAIRNIDMFSALENGIADAQSEEGRALLRRTVEESARIKCDIVTQDEREGGVRALLNFGHTIGHGIEALRSATMLHGECVAIGMVKEAEIARAMGHVSSADVARLVKAISACQLPIHVPGGLSVDAIMTKMGVDKKSRNGTKKCVLLERIGASVGNVAHDVGDDLLRLVLARSLSVVPVTAPANGEIRVPGSKSISNRVLLLASLGKGTCRIKGLLHSDDTAVMMAALAQLHAATFEWEDNGRVLVVHGGGGEGLQSPHSDASQAPIYLGNAGTASRFLTTACTLLPTGQSVELCGDGRMHERPVKDLLDALINHQGCAITPLKDPRCLPLLIEGCGGLKGGDISMNARVSSQYVSSVLMSAPYARSPVTLHLEGGVAVSLPYIRMTTAMMRQFGVEVEEIRGDGVFSFRVPQAVYVNPPVYVVEADASSATYPLAMAAATGGRVVCDAVGSGSLQGDANFHKLLESMGCEVSQDKCKTIISAPASQDDPFRLKAVDIDMEPMTDAFMTAAVLAATADGTTRITGIANQRVKECNRIAVMVNELAKCGVTSRELPDGIEIEGRTAAELNGAVIECHNDHRIAMSFAVLGLSVPGVILDDKECVRKTYPEFWEHLRNSFGVQYDTRGSTTDAAVYVESENSSKKRGDVIVIVGMRGAGKTRMGGSLARALGFKCVDVDADIETELGQTIKSFVDDGSAAKWKSFRSTESMVFERELGAAIRLCGEGVGTVISCGGGIVETPVSHALLSTHRSHVVHLHRNHTDVLTYLGADPERPSIGSDLTAVWERRKPLYEACSSVEFYIPALDDSVSAVEDWKRTECEFTAFVRGWRGVGTRGRPSACGKAKDFFEADGKSVTVSPTLTQDFGLPPPPPTYDTSPTACGDLLSSSSFFVCFTYKDVKQSLPVLSRLTEGAHAIELRADLLSSLGDEFVAGQLAFLRRWTSLPIIFTVRTSTQGGSYQVGEGEDGWAALAHTVTHALRCGAQLVDVEQCWPESVKKEIHGVAQALRRKVIVSEHCYQDSYTPGELRSYFEKCLDAGRASVAKVVIKAHHVRDVYELRRIAEESERESGVPHISLAISRAGQLSRVLNRHLTPVTHPALPSLAAPGQMSIQEIHQARALIGLDSPVGPQLNDGTRKLYLFGSPIAKSPSPATHNAGFKAVGLESFFEYSLCDTGGSLQVALDCLSRSDSFGGNVTIPHKQEIIPHLHRISRAAAAIGAVNTLRRTTDGTGWLGFNTDWLGIAVPVRRALWSRASAAAPTTATTSSTAISVVVGAGGTARAACYALKELGHTVVVVNRTLANAQSLAKEFGVHWATLAEPLDIDGVNSADARHADVIVCTVPSSAQSGDTLTAVKQLIECAQVPPIVMDVAYIPRVTPALKYAREKGCSTVDGPSMLLHQAVVCWEIWTGSRAPGDQMTTALEKAAGAV